MWCKILKEFLGLIISIILLLIVFELFCADMKISKFVKFAFSAMIAFLCATCIIKGVERIASAEDFLVVTENEGESIISDQITNLEKILSTRIKLECDVICEVKITYCNDGNETIYELIEVFIKNSDNHNVNEIEKLIKEYLECPVVIYD